MRYILRNIAIGCALSVCLTGCKEPDSTASDDVIAFANSLDEVELLAAIAANRSNIVTRLNSLEGDDLTIERLHATGSGHSDEWTKTFVILLSEAASKAWLEQKNADMSPLLKALLVESLIERFGNEPSEFSKYLSEWKEIEGIPRLVYCKFTDPSDEDFEETLKACICDQTLEDLEYLLLIHLRKELLSKLVLEELEMTPERMAFIRRRLERE